MTDQRGLPFVWGASEAECAKRYPCDAHLQTAQHAFFRAIDVDASAAVMYRWLQQLRIAPYSYDWADNFLLPSPPRLTPRADAIAIGQRIMHVFSIVALEPGRTLTVGPRSRLAAALFGTLCGTYTVTPHGANRCRLLVKVNAIYPSSVYGRIVCRMLPWIDLIMMRKQLLRLKACAEGTARARSSDPVDRQNGARMRPVTRQSRHAEFTSKGPDEV